MLTRCPGCATVFRVTPEQLKARHGKVRCGQCAAVFNALDSLVEESLPAAETLQEPSDEAVEETTSALAAEPETPAEALAAVEEAEETPPAAAAEPQEDPELPEPEREAETDPEPQPYAEVASILQPDATDDGQIDMRAGVGLLLRSADEAPQDTIESADEVVKAARTKRGRPWWILGIVLATFALAAQATIHFRMALAQWQPALKPTLIAACRPLGCKLPLPSDPALLGLEASSLSPDPQHPEHLLLSATIRNHAKVAQDFPHLEVTLTDVANRKLAVKVFAAREYLPADTDFRRGLPADEDVTANLALDAHGLPVVGYLAYIFYP